MTEATPSPATLHRVRQVILAACYGLILNFLISSLLAMNGLSLATLVIWLIQILPLMLFMPGLHRQRLRSYAWVSFVVLLYFMHGVLVAFDPGRRLLGLIEVGLCVLLFTLLIVYIRQYRQTFGVGL